MTTASPKRYSPLWVSIHWLTALLIFAEFYLGLTSVGLPPEAKAPFLRLHMPIGVTLLLLAFIRLFIRWRTPRPEDATTGNRTLDRIGKGTHHLLYILLIFMALAGLGLSIRYNLPSAVFEGQTPVPADLNPGLHGLLFLLFALLILLHIGAALYHQFILRDNLLARMWYGR
ncbi:MAG: cytochrome b561 [Anaerolineales bacterium]